MFKKKVFGSRIEPACAHCEHGSFTSDRRSVLCAKKGIVSPSFSCRKYVYAPLKRVPRGINPRLPEFSPEDFEL